VTPRVHKYKLIPRASCTSRWYVVILIIGHRRSTKPNVIPSQVHIMYVIYEGGPESNICLGVQINPSYTEQNCMIHIWNARLLRLYIVAVHIIVTVYKFVCAKCRHLTNIDACFQSYMCIVSWVLMHTFFRLAVDMFYPWLDSRHLRHGREVESPSLAMRLCLAVFYRQFDCKTQENSIESSVIAKRWFSRITQSVTRPSRPLGPFLRPFLSITNAFVLYYSNFFFLIQAPNETLVFEKWFLL